jgi:hypothetical protein
LEIKSTPRPKYVLEYDGALSDDVKRDLERNLEGRFRPGEVIALERGMKLRPIDGGELPTAEGVHDGLRRLGDLGFEVNGRDSLTWSSTGYEYRNAPLQPRTLPPERQVMVDSAAFIEGVMQGTQAWKLALATAAVWVVAVATGVM